MRIDPLGRLIVFSVVFAKLGLTLGIDWCWRWSAQAGDCCGLRVSLFQVVKQLFRVCELARLC
jgi:hypothetical protein